MEKLSHTNIDINKINGKIIISGFSDKKELARKIIHAYLSEDDNILFEEYINLNGYTQKQHTIIKRCIIDEQCNLRNLGVLVNIMPYDVIIRGPKKCVINARDTIIAIIMSLLNENVDCTPANVPNHEICCVFCNDDAINLVKLDACSCNYCNECFKYLMTNAFQDRDALDIKCIGCNTAIAFSDLQKLDLDDANTVLSGSLNNYLTANWNEYIHCPTPDCGNLFYKNERRLLNCDKCYNVYCLSCNVNYFEDPRLSNIGSHEGISCVSLQNLGTSKTEDEEWLNSNTKKCPNCNINIQKKRWL